jgi:hypothetical protein
MKGLVLRGRTMPEPTAVAGVRQLTGPQRSLPASSDISAVTGRMVPRHHHDNEERALPAQTNS